MGKTPVGSFDLWPHVRRWTLPTSDMIARIFQVCRFCLMTGSLRICIRQDCLAATEALRDLADEGVSELVPGERALAEALCCVLLPEGLVWHL